jgi:alkanesulfonate monooxygenase SsuD/methylene tetrahydromethanopterin reductase-like flavin-dependent oxidoreductase (luciferase family)
MKSALWLPLFDDLADPLTVMRVAAEAEEAGWHGVFVWDHLRWRAPVRQAADPWITLAAVATATEQVRLGPMVMALPRRRPAKVARETATLDLLSRGRLTPGVGIGSDRLAGESSKTGERPDDRARGEMLDEPLAILTTAWTGAPVHHHGRPYTINDIEFLPRPVQQPGIPVWTAGFTGNIKPMRRAARYDGFFPVNLEPPDQLAEAAAAITELRQGSTTPFDVVASLPIGVDPHTVCRGGRHLVAPRARARGRIARPGEGRRSRWPAGPLNLGTETDSNSGPSGSSSQHRPWAARRSA